MAPKHGPFTDRLERTANHPSVVTLELAHQ